MPSPTSTATPTPQPTITPTPTATPTPIPTFTLSGAVFFDYNGNGIRDEGEPPIPGAKVQVGSLIATAGPDGSYTLKGVPQGKQQVRLSAPDFRYISLSVEAFQPAERPVSVTVEGDAHRDWGLMQGFLTLPFKCCPQYTRPSPFGFTGMVDIDRRPGYVRSFDPAQVPTNTESGGNPPWAYDQHDGLDFCVPEGTEVVAAAPGEVVASAYEPQGAGHLVIIYHPSSNTYTFYAHLAEKHVAVGQRVNRGQPIGLSGNTGLSGEPHLHFAHWEKWDPNTPLDPYRTVGDCDNCRKSPGFWTINTGNIYDPRYP
jgi:murein DD-endopeptidase MepM/ murein hydrolase activator NlpD